MNNKQNIKFITITIGSYPFGTATSVRNMTLLQGLQERGCNTELISLYPDKNQDLSSYNHKGIYNNVSYIYSTKILKFQQNKIKQYYSFLLSVFRCSKLISNNKAINTVILNQIANPFISLLVTILVKRKCRLYLHEATEFPFIRKQSGRIAKFVYNKLIVPKFDKIFVISSALKQYFEGITKPDKVAILNMFVDLKRFEQLTEPIFDFEYIAYCGSMNTDKDGVPILINAFAEVVKQHPTLKLVLIGDNKNRPIDSEIMTSIRKHHLEKDIVFTGHINATQIPSYLKGAKILTLARPNNIQAKGGFPTKLGEYLATGKPVVVTNVGDIPKFIINNENGYLSEPNSDDFANKILNILEKYDSALKIGASGKKIAEKEFNYKNEVHKIINTIK